jgi:amino acid transporter
MHEQKYSVFWGLPILSSDAVSSIAYASEEILIVLVPVLGILAYSRLAWISLAIIGLLFILMFSYRQTISCYPQGGGAYTVASENLGALAGVTAGAALAVDYVLTVAVSVSSGVAAITSAFPGLLHQTIPICLIVLVLLMVGNLRGIKESARIFSFPAYAFIFSIGAMIVVGLIKVWLGFVPIEPQIIVPSSIDSFAMTVLLLAAFSNGCAALTGIEAVSNAVSHFKDPAPRNAQKVLVLLALLVFVMFGGTSLLANLYHVVPLPDRTVLSQIAAEIFGKGFMFYFIQVSTMIILMMAANTAYTGFPSLVAIMAKEEYAPRQLCRIGDRLSFSNGIKLLTLIAGILIVIFRGSVSALIPLYAIGVFISFTLSQSGMFVRWIRVRGSRWQYKALINGFGALVTAAVVVIIAYTKFLHGAWLVMVVIPVLVMLMRKINAHYKAIALQIGMTSAELMNIDVNKDLYRNRVIVPIESINRSSVRALRYARTISDNVIAFNVSLDQEHSDKVRQRYALIKTDIPLIVKYSPFRKVVEPLIKFIESEEYSYKKGDMITVILPQFSTKSWWHRILHNHSRYYIERELIKHKHIVVSTMPLQLRTDEEVLNKK